MTYKVNITDHADELLDNILSYLLYNLRSQQAALHFLAGLENIYARLKNNPYQFPLSKNIYLSDKGYHEALIPQMNYLIIFEVSRNIVTVLGIFHHSENYETKL